MRGLLWLAALLLPSASPTAAQDGCVRYVDGTSSCAAGRTVRDSPDELQRRNSLRDIRQAEDEIAQGQRDEDDGNRLIDEGQRISGPDGARRVTQGRAIRQTGLNEKKIGQDLLSRARSRPFDEGLEAQREQQQAQRLIADGERDYNQGAIDRDRGARLEREGQRVGGVYGKDLQIEGKKYRLRGEAEQAAGSRALGRGYELLPLGGSPTSTAGRSVNAVTSGVRHQTVHGGIRVQTVHRGVSSQRKSGKRAVTLP